LHIARPGHLSRGLVLVKWLLALPHYLVIGFFVGGGTYAVWRFGEWTSAAGNWSTAAGGLIGLLVLIAGIALLFTGRYPRGVFDLVLGMHRWVLRVVAYAALMTDAYPPFRLDTGGTDTAALAVAPTGPDTAGGTSLGGGTELDRTAEPGKPSSGHGPWTPARIVSVVVGSLLVASAVGMAAGATALLVADRAGREADGFIGTPAQRFTSTGYALELDAVDLRTGAGTEDVDPGTFLGDVRVRASADGEPVFVGIGPADAVSGYLGDVDRSVLGDPAADGRSPRHLPGGAPAAAPGTQPFWVASSGGPGIQQVTWTATTGRWAVVVMNADGSRPVVAEVSGAVTAPALAVVWIGLFVATGVTFVVGAVLVGLSIPRRSSI
jgi:hypothetical protein